MRKKSGFTIVEQAIAFLFLSLKKVPWKPKNPHIWLFNGKSPMAVTACAAFGVMRENLKKHPLPKM